MTLKMDTSENLVKIECVNVQGDKNKNKTKTVEILNS